MSTKTVEVNTPYGVWVVPHGLGRHYRDVAGYHYSDASLATDTLSDILALVGYEMSGEDLLKLDPRLRADAEVWATRLHTRASDNIVYVPTRPHWLPEPWQGNMPEGTPTPVQLPTESTVFKPGSYYRHIKSASSICIVMKDGVMAYWTSAHIPVRPLEGSAHRPEDFIEITEEDFWR